MRPPLLQLLMDEFNNEVDRHAGEKPVKDVWMAQVDAFGARLHRRLAEVTAEMIREAITTGPLCLHRAIAPFDDVLEALRNSYDITYQALMALEAEREKMAGEEDAEEGGEA